MEEYLISDVVGRAIDKGVITEGEVFFMYSISRKADLGSITSEERIKRKEILKRYNNFVYA
ncbi:hypothetical protein Goe27_02280 [Bacillus phage vB_BsuM-Goe27]|uniref:Uncharacterized protein n=1 Tax=Bacillus phage vB_BsuM-Goe3 TaxID=1933063 RepID=A0A217ERE7_BPGO3|nr:hypothetical protein HWB07_gp088 [Bacillus phage vB_BsuM-Goe3]APZ82682.1 hypothetical protein Goe3_c22100 [Bacillus phage vB_BsuM-Goe3]QDP43250.1 hypothetical protein Goe7_c02250 [Bacillus phage vB_BveM-Goe7]WCS69602.1 hypothetical protein Goe24_02270 [Bacillus phage vB_BsuM-Goe24]WCS70106.1 hypothetical protein Goe27_02280 [Bacillus phage vB_BsuM-Goe27]